MPLAAGTRLGNYDIVGPLGAGGMGEVYRAKDTKLDRDVAIKVLPAAFAQHPERLVRFEREAKVLASLDHRNIASIYAVEESSEGKALVMELVKGQTLKGPVPLDTALKYAAQIASALDAAHEKGITHRDLKPANIMLTPDGTIKVLDFGLAAVTQPSQSDGEAGTNKVTLTMSPTSAGMIMGTAAYMSPEQARGQTVDRRADIWSFGVVLWELLTGKQLFGGDTVSDMLASVLKEEPNLALVAAKTRPLLKRCLEKDPKKRLQAIGDWELLLVEDIPAASVPVPAPSRFAWVAWAVAGVMTAIAAVSMWAQWRGQRPVDRPMTRLSVDLGPKAVRGRFITAALSPDGTRIVYTGRAEAGQLQLFARPLDQAESIPLAGTASSTTQFPFFSPDGQWIGFYSLGKFKKVAAQGGSAVTLGDVPSFYGASWGDDGNIIFGSQTGLMRMPAAGGVAQAVKGGEGVHLFPQVLPGAGAVLTNPLRGNNIGENLDVDILEFGTGKQKTLLHGGYWPRYLATNGETGHLVYMHEGTLFGVAFDPKREEIHGTPTPLLEDVGGGIGEGGQSAFSETGTFVYLSAAAQKDAYPILSLDTSGKTAPLVEETGAYSAPRFSPDGKRLAYTAAGPKGVDVWVDDLERHTRTQLTFTGPGSRELAWAPDSKHLVFSDGTALWWIRADGSGQPQLLLDKSGSPRPTSFAPDGRLAFSPITGGLPDIFTLPVDLSDLEHPKAGKAEPFLADPQAIEVDAAFSPDGKFLAYASGESGANEVFVQPFPGPGGRWKISTAGGKFPVWSRSAHELLFLGSDDHIMVVNYTIESGSFSFGKPRAWSPAQVRRTGVQQNFDLAPDGKRVAIFPRAAWEGQQQGSLHATFLLNFFDELRRKVPTGK